MSKLFPKELADVLRVNTDSLVELNGQHCRLHKVEGVSYTDTLRDKAIITFKDPIDTYVLIHWSPEVRRLKALGLFVEGELPILAYFKFEDDPNAKDYIELDYHYSIGDMKTNKFEITDRKLRGHDAEARAVWVLAPRRIS